MSVTVKFLITFIIVKFFHHRFEHTRKYLNYTNLVYETFHNTDTVQEQRIIQNRIVLRILNSHCSLVFRKIKDYYRKQ